MTPSRSASSNASSWSWVTRIVVTPRSRWMVRSARRNSMRILASSAPSGSSSSSTSGLMARARARATRCCWPPESWRGMRLPSPTSPTSSSSSSRQRRRSAAAHLAQRHAELDVVGHRHVLEERVVLEDEADAPFLRGQAGHVAAMQQDAPLVDAGQAGHHVEHGGLAAAAGAEQDKELAVGDLQRDIVDHRVAAVAFGEVFEDDGHRRGGGGGGGGGGGEKKKKKKKNHSKKCC